MRKADGRVGIYDCTRVGIRMLSLVIGLGLMCLEKIEDMIRYLSLVMVSDGSSMT